jgi:tRNA(Ile)-lysidine synthase TilS/MesJ
VARKPQQKYDCVVGISGGLDSTYLLFYLVKVCNLQPLAVHFDNGWNTDVAKHNMRAICRILNVDFEEYEVDLNEFNDIILAFLKSGAIDIDAPTDIGLITTLYKAADRHKIKYIIEGHSFRT